MEATRGATATKVELADLFSNLVRLETELWDLVDHRLRKDHDLPLSWFEPMQVVDRVVDSRVSGPVPRPICAGRASNPTLDRAQQRSGPSSAEF